MRVHQGAPAATTLPPVLRETAAAAASFATAVVTQAQRPRPVTIDNVRLPQATPDTGPRAPPPPAAPGIFKRVYRYAQTVFGTTHAIVGKPELTVTPQSDPLLAPPQMGVSMPTTGNIMDRMIDGAAFSQALLARIAESHESIWLSYYVFDPDSEGEPIVRALIDKMKNEHVVVRLISDNRDGARDYVDPSADMGSAVTRLRAAGADVVRSPTRDMSINHRKIAVFDGHKAMVTGFNFTDRYLRPNPDQQTYHDSGVQVCGPAVLDIAAIFSFSWEDATGQILPLPPRLPKLVGHYSDAAVQTILHDGRRDRNIENALLQRINAAQHTIRLANSNPMSDSIENALEAAIARGVSVEWLWGRQSTATEGVTSRRTLQQMIDAGAKVYEYPALEHLKVYTFDSMYTLRGSSNLDGFSTWLDDEAMLQISSEEFARDTDSEFASDEAKSQRLSTAPSLSTGSRIKDWAERQGEKRLDAAHQRWEGDPVPAQLSWVPRFRR